ATVAVDRRLLREALRHLVGTAPALASRAEHAALRLERRAGEIGIGLELRGAPREGWRLPRAFEPYYIAGAMRGSSFGLGLFIVQRIVHAPGGGAVALRRLVGTVVFDLALPTVGPGRPPPRAAERPNRRSVARRCTTSPPDATPVQRARHRDGPHPGRRPRSRDPAGAARVPRRGARARGGLRGRRGPPTARGRAGRRP